MVNGRVIGRPNPLLTLLFSLIACQEGGGDHPFTLTGCYADVLTLLFSVNRRVGVCMCAI